MSNVIQQTNFCSEIVVCMYNPYTEQNLYHCGLSGRFINCLYSCDSRSERTLHTLIAPDRSREGNTGNSELVFDEDVKVKVATFDLNCVETGIVFRTLTWLD